MSLVFWMLILCALSILLNDPPAYFKAWKRFLAFSVSIIIVTPLFICRQANKLRRQLFSIIMIISVVISVASFACYYLGINFFTVSNEVLSIDAGRFSGLFNHSMVLGPIAGLSAIYSFSYGLTKRRHSVFLLAITVLCVGSVLFSASRSALGSCIFGLAIAYLRFFRGKISRGLVLGIAIIGIIAALYPLWGSWTDFVVIKQQNNIDGGSVFMSREAFWQARLTEIRQNPLTGVGFCCVDPSLTYVDPATGMIEPGSSWMAVFSMTGLFGFIIFLFIYVKSFRLSYAIINKEESCVLSGCIAFFGVHLLFEGYIFAVGSFLGLLYWLLLGCIMAAPTRASLSESIE